MKRLVYLAGGMEYASDGKSWREDAAKELNKIGYSSWDPYKEEPDIFKSKKMQEFFKRDNKIEEFTKYRDIMRSIIKLDLGTIKDDADILLVKFDQSVLRGAGTKSEISIATLFNKPVHVWLSGLSLRDVPSWCLGSFNTVSTSLTATIKKLKDYENKTPK